ncbi:hypothetical protein L208DRAFT_1383181 [Tricholoma matsutake]|nr:hypothetical protein L208DRAFT_1383181 [Tricholoma matsutake 945]
MQSYHISTQWIELEHIVEKAKDKTNDQKAKAKVHKAIQQKLEEDHIEDALQTASMNSLCKLSVDKRMTTGTVTPVTHTSSISSTDTDGASTQPSIVTKTTTVTGHAEKRQADASPSEEPKPKCYHESAQCPAPKLAAKSST